MINSVKEVLVFRAKVNSVEEKFEKRWLSGQGEDAKFTHVSIGWYVGLKGSHEILFAGMIKPNIKIGDSAKITMSFTEEEDNAKE